VDGKFEGLMRCSRILSRCCSCVWGGCRGLNLVSTKEPESYNSVPEEDVAFAQGEAVGDLSTNLNRVSKGMWFRGCV